ncbi:MAG TPA: PQQ-dependent sugar dehydrogenase, partial [Candidatus Marinimicrobia bacterium]|nr:PQQ-dependent sugar dehydrogenase [Candidatus Neomarinimicrobiota bacterium]
MPKIFAKIIFTFTVLFSQNIGGDWDQGSYDTQLLSFQVNTFSTGYDIPWGMAFLPNGELLVTDISGSLWRVSKNGREKRQIGNSLVVYYKGQGGLLDVQVHPDFERNHLIYLCYSDIQRKNLSHTTVARAVLNDHSLEDFQIIYKAPEQLFTKISRHF